MYIHTEAWSGTPLPVGDVDSSQLQLYPHNMLAFFPESEYDKSETRCCVLPNSRIFLLHSTALEEKNAV